MAWARQSRSVSGEPQDEVKAALKSVGFDDQKLKSEIGHLSGGWKMKLGLVRAMLMCADILLLDEPTGHLDVANVSWLGDYLLLGQFVDSGWVPTAAWKQVLILMAITGHQSDQKVPADQLPIDEVSSDANLPLSLGKDAARPVTTIVVSHDTTFLDKVCSHVINVKQRKPWPWPEAVTAYHSRRSSPERD
eukprot:Skav214635  [mRNA]  locus=scaffold1009:62862:67811:- [translate_table: standard]